ncbi:hypothetical protein NMY22_g3879 [Coprinellus aureogranulatus]|nr:hypothetical protein NMY22_g3879 [Coprinellus aureogranulatus]
MMTPAQYWISGGSRGGGLRSSVSVELALKVNRSTNEKTFVCRICGGAVTTGDGAVARSFPRPLLGCSFIFSFSRAVKDPGGGATDAVVYRAPALERIGIYPNDTSLEADKGGMLASGGDTESKEQAEGALEIKRNPSKTHFDEEKPSLPPPTDLQHLSSSNQADMSTPRRVGCSAHSQIFEEETPTHVGVSLVLQLQFGRDSRRALICPSGCPWRAGTCSSALGKRNDDPLRSMPRGLRRPVESTSCCVSIEVTRAAADAAKRVATTESPLALDSPPEVALTLSQLLYSTSRPEHCVAAPLIPLLANRAFGMHTTPYKVEA